MSNIIFFGDSITEGANSEQDFVGYLNNYTTAYNVGISGTTIGEYSIYPVDGQSLSALYPKIDLSRYDEIFLEYGTNDVSAIMCGFTTLQKVIVSFVKAIDGIHQKNPSAKIRFLAISLDHNIILEHSKLQCAYLKEDYFKGYDFNFPVNLCASLYEQLIEDVQKRVEVIPMIEDIRFFSPEAECIGNDNLHPNEKGHIIIADTIKKYI